MNGYRELGRCSAMCSRFDASGFDLIGAMSSPMMPLSGMSYFPFYRPRESTGYSGGKEKNEREPKAFRIARSFLSFIRVLPTL